MKGRNDLCQIKCNVCGKEFEASLSSHYIARDNKTSGAISALGNTEETLYDAYDCPACGSQFIAQSMKRQFETISVGCDHGSLNLDNQDE